CFGRNQTTAGTGCAAWRIERGDVMPIVSSSAGKLRGVRLDNGLIAFRGIPYAAAPVGPLRWRPPSPVTPWADVKDALDFGADAIQVQGIRESRAPAQSEDCLFLNIWA